MGFILNDKTYNVLKVLTTYILPPVAALYFTLSTIWGFPYAEQIVGTIAAIETFMGAVLGISSKNFKAQSAETK